MNKYDVIIIGGGLGGLACGSILSKEGMNVCVLEKNHIIGGCLQSFSREGYILDTGMHYVGSLSEGQVMHQYFKYFGVAESVRLRKLDEDGFDTIIFGDGSRYSHAMGYEHFVDTLAADFPHERGGIERYCGLMRKIGALISSEMLRGGKISGGGIEYMGMSAYEAIASCVKDETLRNVLAGSNTLYAGDPSTTSLYEHGMITHSNIEGCYCFEGGSQHVADALVAVVRKNGGEVRTNAEVSKIVLDGDRVKYIGLADGECLETKNVISAIHPAAMLSLLEQNTIIKKAFFTRVNSLKNSYGVFTTYLLMKPQTQPYINRNYYIYNTNNVWSVESNYNGCNIPSVLMCMQANRNNDYADVITLLIPMPQLVFEQWNDTKTGHRGKAYEEFKLKYSEQICDFVCRYFPELRSRIKSIYTTSPLTYRDFTGTPNGSAYGIVKDYHNPIITHLPSRTKIENLFITGQNLNVHGCLGTSISAAVSCSELLGVEYLAKKIGDA